MIDLDKMAKEHEKLFPIATLKGQRKKYLEEAGEFIRAETKEQKIKELADCVIVCAGMCRFNPTLAQRYMINIWKTSLWSHIKEKDLEAEVNRKWQINLSRKWEYKHGRYHHVGTDGNE